MVGTDKQEEEKPNPVFLCSLAPLPVLSCPRVRKGRQRLGDSAQPIRALGSWFALVSGVNLSLGGTPV